MLDSAITTSTILIDALAAASNFSIASNLIVCAPLLLLGSLSSEEVVSVRVKVQDSPLFKHLKPGGCFCGVFFLGLINNLQKGEI